jgi:hypothetical protein
MSREGLLIPRWGAKTKLQMPLHNREIRTRGLVAELVPAPTQPDRDAWKLAQNVSDALSRGGFIPRLWLYDKEEAEGPIFCERVIAEKPDSIVWLTPPPRPTTLGYRLMSCGIRVIKVMAVADVISEFFI